MSSAEERPIAIKMIPKPITKAMIFKRCENLCFFSFLAKNARYMGSSGKIQGEIKLNIPAIKAEK